MTFPATTAFYAALLALLYLGLSGWVMAERLSGNILHGDGGDADLQKRMRSQANFVEYVPIALILIALLEARGAGPVDLRAVVPVNLRPLNVPLPRELGNRFGMVFLPLPLGTGEPMARLWELKRRMDALKRSPEAAVVFGMLTAAGLAPAPVERAAVEVMRRKSSLVLTQVPGPRKPVFLAGARLSGMAFWVPMAGRLGLGLSLFRYAGQVTLGVAVDAGLVPEPRLLIADFEAELDALAQAVHDTGRVPNVS